MNTLSEQLTSLYESKWDKLMQQLDKRQIKTQCPFVLSVQRNGSEDWYAGADIKVMFFGQEVHSWEKNEDLGDTMRAYERFFEEKYVDDGAKAYMNGQDISDDIIVSYYKNGRQVSFIDTRMVGEYIVRYDVSIRKNK